MMWFDGATGLGSCDGGGWPIFLQVAASIARGLGRLRSDAPVGGSCKI